MPTAAQQILRPSSTTSEAPTTYLQQERRADRRQRAVVRDGQHFLSEAETKQGRPPRPAGATAAVYGFFLCTVAFGAARGGVPIFPAICVVLGVPLLVGGIVLLLMGEPHSHLASSAHTSPPQTGHVSAERPGAVHPNRSDRW